MGNEVTTKMTKLATQIVPVDTGALRDSIEQIPAVLKRKIIRRQTIEFGFSAGGGIVDYARYVEYGTSKRRIKTLVQYKMRPQPYMWPAARSFHPLLIKRLKEVGKLDG